MNNQQLLNKTIQFLSQLKDNPKAGISGFGKQKISELQAEIHDKLQADKTPENPCVALLIEGGIIQHICATRGDIQFTVLDKDLDAEEEFHLQKKGVDEIVFGPTDAVNMLKNKE